MIRQQIYSGEFVGAAHLPWLRGSSFGAARNIMGFQASLAIANAPPVVQASAAFSRNKTARQKNQLLHKTDPSENTENAAPLQTHCKP